MRIFLLHQALFIKGIDMQTKTVRKFWEFYKSAVLPPTASPIQVSECQLAFYGGATSILGEILRLGNEGLSEKKAVQGLQALLDEITEFKSLVLSKPRGSKI
jgi:hypothetical protein